MWELILITLPNRPRYLWIKGANREAVSIKVRKAKGFKDHGRQKHNSKLFLGHMSICSIIENCSLTEQ